MCRYEGLTAELLPAKNLPRYQLNVHAYAYLHTSHLHTYIHMYICDRHTLLYLYLCTHKQCLWLHVMYILIQRDVVRYNGTLIWSSLNCLQRVDECNNLVGMYLLYIQTNNKKIVHFLLYIQFQWLYHSINKNYRKQNQFRQMFLNTNYTHTQLHIHLMLQISL